MNVKLTPEMIEAGYAALTASYDALVLTLNPNERALQNYLVWAGRSLSSPRAPVTSAVPDAVDLS